MTREEIITKIKSFCHNCEKFPTCVNTDKECFKALEMAIEALSAEPKTGHWQNNACSNCGIYNASAYKNWCPNCGAKMVEPQESEE